MNLSAPFIRRPVATILLSIALLFSGILAYTKLAVAPLPRVDFPTIQVSAALPGAGPETMAAAVATPLERRFGRISGLTEMTSTSSLGSSAITLQFELDRNIDVAARDVQAAIAAAGGELPPNLPTKPTFRKVNPADAPVLIFALGSDTIPLPQVFDAANTILVQKISQVPGVGQVTVGGGQQPAVRVEYDPAAIAAMNLGSGDLRSVIRGATAAGAKGSITNGEQTIVIGANDQLLSASEFEKVQIARSRGGAVELGRIATVKNSVENARLAGWSNAKRAVVLMIFKQPDADIIGTTERVKALLPELMAELSPAIDVTVASDRTMTIRASVKDVEEALLLSMLLVIVVVFGFLRSWRATLVPLVAMPLSIVGTFGVMWLLGYSIDNLSLMALTISTGFVVDDAIVVTENIIRELEKSSSPFDAALKGAKQIGFTVVSITLSLLAVFVPILLMGGIVGRLFREFAVTLSSAVLISAAVSLTVTPMLCALLLRPAGSEARGRLYQWSERAFDRLLKTYERGLLWAVGHRKTMLLVTLATVAVNVGLFAIVPKGLFPTQDTGMLSINTVAAQNVSYAEMSRLQKQVNEIITADKDVANLVSFIGSGGFGTTNSGRGFVTLAPRPPRAASADEVIARLRAKLSKIVGISSYLTSRQDVNVGGRIARTLYQYTLQDANLEELREWAPRITQEMQKLPLLRDVNSDQQNAALEINIDVDRDTAARLGVTMQAVDAALYDAYGQAFTATTYAPRNAYRVVLEAESRFRSTPQSLDNIFVKSSSGVLVPLRAFSKLRESLTPLSVNHNGQFPCITIAFNLAPGASLGEAVDAIHERERALHLPTGLHADFQGTAQAFTASLQSEPWLVLAALITVYLVLGILYESYLHPITILSTLPSAGIGAIAALLLFKADLSIIAIIGLLLLIGIVKKNAILLIDVAIEEVRHGASPEAAIVRACSLRFRPILMTTLAALFGALPLAFGTGLGSELRQPLGITIVGGLAASQLLTLFTTPVVYLTLESWKQQLQSKFKGGKPTQAPEQAQAAS